MDSESYSGIRLLEINSELELYRILNGISEEALGNADDCPFNQYDAMTEPNEQFQITKYEIETRMEKANCCVVFIVHVDSRLSNKMNRVFSFGDGWKYCLVDEILPVSQSVEHRIPLKIMIDLPFISRNKYSTCPLGSVCVRRDLKTAIFSLLSHYSYGK